MFVPAHLFAGLILGKISGIYTVALIGAVLIDLDHIWIYLRHKILFNPKKLWKTITDPKDKYGNQRNFLHSFITWIIISALILFVDYRIGFVFSLAYLSHLTLDLLDGSDFYLFYPFEKFKVKGPIKYFSREEIVITLILLLVFLVI